MKRMDVKAYLRHLRMAPRKVRLVADVIRGLPVTEAETRLSFLQKDAARPLLKLLKSACANASHNFKLEPSTLMVKTIMVDAGATLKRSMPRAMGRATPVRKRSSHITLILATRAENLASFSPKARNTARRAPRTRASVVSKSVSPTAPPAEASIEKTA